MPLPKIATPTYSMVLPSTEKEINYRPFLVKEEKLLVLALESEDTKQITQAIKAVLKSCVQTKGIKVESLPTFIKSNFDFKDENAMDQSFKLIASCVDKIYTDEEVWVAADCTKKEITEFLESMNSSQFKKIEEFFTSMPKLSHTIKVKNPNTKVESEVVLEGLASFFG